MGLLHQPARRARRARLVTGGAAREQGPRQSAPVCRAAVGRADGGTGPQRGPEEANGGWVVGGCGSPAGCHRGGAREHFLLAGRPAPAHETLLYLPRDERSEAATRTSSWLPEASSGSFTLGDALAPCRVLAEHRSDRYLEPPAGWLQRLGAETSATLGEVQLAATALAQIRDLRGVW
jgi:hypothetical protein